jgi:sporulation protein YlmC with PRC-barrel domain
MILTAENFYNLEAITESGQVLGKIKSFHFDTIDFKIVKFYIKPHSLLKKFSTLIVDINQIIDINEKRILVYDSVLKSKVEKEMIDNKIKENLGVFSSERK